MRGKVAKRLRKQIYEEQSTRQRRKYSFAGGTGNSKKLFQYDLAGRRRAYGTIVNVGLRQEYLDAKRDYKHPGKER